MKKYLTISLIILTIVLSFISYIPVTYALTEVYVNGDDVRFRNAASTSATIITTLNQGTKVTLNSQNKINGPGCDEGWYSISYNNKNGYICSSYISTISPTTNDYRPWTSPKKAIYGGAYFISSGYISEGQNTSYLKKFNVNPNAGYSMFTHQYMANLAAPMNEAATSYKSYKENNLLSLPLQFTIPIFNNMPEKTSHPVTGEEKGGTSQITDQAFEKQLDAEGFPETYKVWLREIHKTYSNWTFKTLKTNVDFNTAVENEKWASSINKSSCSKCVDGSNINTEGNWYVANTQTTAYFLDPRNFLMVDSILMFEDLSYNSNYTEKVVASVLNNTFMSGTDKVDKLSYATIFVDAGKENNVSPVYLASLARQEVGVNGGLTTNGERFEYKGSTYEGFYNFFNIGAYSSEENPAKAGLVYAAKGASKNSEGVYCGSSCTSSNQSNNNSNNSNPSTQTNPQKPSENNNNTNNNNSNTNNNNTPQQTKPTTPTAIPATSYLEKMNLTKKGNYITNVSIGQTVKELKAIVGNDVIIKKANGTTLGDTEPLATGSTMTFKTGETMEVVVYGDLSGDGQINSADLLRMRQALLKKVTLTGAFQEAAHVQTLSGELNSSDLLRLRQHLLGKKYINQA